MEKQFKTAVIYARYSSDNQTEQSIEGQLRICEQYAQFNNILILDTYIDRAMTGTNDNRPDFQRMLDDSKTKNWDYVLVYKFDRFSRDKYQSVLHKKTLKDNGVKLISAMENIPDSPEGIILESLLEAMSQYYSMELSQKVKRGMNESRLKGHFTGGFLLYGYKVENKKVIIDEEQAEVVRYIYNQYSIGVFVKDILAELTSKGIYNRGKPFARSTIYNILKNEKYAGIYRHNEEVFYNIYPQIVPDEIYNAVRAKITSNKYGKRSTEIVYLLKNKLKCGYCGSSITAESGTSHTGIKKRYYKCMGRKLNNGCQKSMQRKEFLEEFVINAILSYLTDKTEFDGMVKSLLKCQDNLVKENIALNMLEREKSQCETALANIMKAIEQGVINSTTNKRMKELEDKLQEIEQKTLLEKSKVSTKITEKEIREYYVQALKLEAKVLINYLVKEIRLYNDKVEILFNSPIALYGISKNKLLQLKQKKSNITNYKVRNIRITNKWLFIPRSS
ncbi:MAG: recombinase family protein [Clostridia bacterium]|nr:recombinase family protein [Clostridia bacterium]